MLIKILAVVAVLAIASWFKAKVCFKWLILIFGICCLTEFLFVFGWYCNNTASKDFPIYEKANATIEQQIADIKEELLQENMNEERLDIILKEYHELENKLEFNNKIIEDYKSWIEEEQQNIESVIFLK